MACSKCQAHRQAIKDAAKSGSAKAVTVESVKALRTFGEQMSKRFSRVTVRKG